MGCDCALALGKSVKVGPIRILALEIVAAKVGPGEEESYGLKRCCCHCCYAWDEGSFILRALTPSDFAVLPVSR